MNTLIKITLILVITVVIYGFYLKETNFEKGNAFIGIGILVLVFILMPLFLIDRYRKKKLTSFIYKHEDGNQK
jgi:cell division protein FtsW (lipid II flippase)